MISISIITATFNARATLPALVESLRGQTDRNFEWVVVDGGSTDGTLDELRRAGDLVPQCASEPDFGIYDALNKGLRRARGDYYLVVGADDVLAPTAIANYRQAALASGADVLSAPIWVGDCLMRPRQGREWMRSGPPMVSAHSVGALIRRQLHAQHGDYSRKFPIAADTYFLLQLQRAGARFVHLEEPAGHFGTEGVSGTDLLGALTESFRANALVRGHWLLHFGLFTLRVLRHARRIGQQTRAKRSP